MEFVTLPPGFEFEHVKELCAQEFRLCAVQSLDYHTIPVNPTSHGGGPERPPLFRTLSATAEKGPCEVGLIFEGFWAVWGNKYWVLGTI